MKLFHKKVKFKDESITFLFLLAVGLDQNKKIELFNTVKTINEQKILGPPNHLVSVYWSNSVCHFTADNELFLT